MWQEYCYLAAESLYWPGLLLTSVSFNSAATILVGFFILCAVGLIVIVTSIVHMIKYGLRNKWDGFGFLSSNFFVIMSAFHTWLRLIQFTPMSVIVVIVISLCGIGLVFWSYKSKFFKSKNNYETSRFLFALSVFCATIAMLFVHLIGTPDTRFMVFFLVFATAILIGLICSISCYMVFKLSSPRSVSNTKTQIPATVKDSSDQEESEPLNPITIA